MALQDWAPDRVPEWWVRQVCPWTLWSVTIWHHWA